MKIYINWQDQKVVTEMQLETEVEEEIDKLESNKDDFAVWLKNRYSAYDIWNITDDELDDILNNWHKYCVAKAIRSHFWDWDEYDLSNT